MCYQNQYQRKAHKEIDEIFLKLLPEAGLSVREEQVKLSHQMLDTLLEGKIALCDAGVGIGKTYAYLVACVLMRRYAAAMGGGRLCDNRPVVISTSSIALAVHHLSVGCGGADRNAFESNRAQGQRAFCLRQPTGSAAGGDPGEAKE